MTQPELYQRVGSWLSAEGADSDVVVSTRVRLARNLVGHRFISRASFEERQELADKLRGASEPAAQAQDAEYYDLASLPELDRHVLVERHLISREHADAEGPRGVLVAENETLSIMINEEDHLRMQTLRSGFAVNSAWERINRLDDAIEAQTPYAFDPRFGYLTACPTNVGTGLRVSVMLHLPALSMTRELQRVFAAAAKIDFIVRGLYGEGTQGHGDFYQLSNQKTLGRAESEILSNLDIVIPQIIRYERKVRNALFNEHRLQVEDRVGRAAGILRNARMISSEETLHLLSQLRLGVNLGLVADLDSSAISRLFIITRPAHLQKFEGRELDAQERDQARAVYIRQHLAGSRHDTPPDQPEADQETPHAL